MDQTGHSEHPSSGAPDSEAAARLFAALYEDLKVMAHHRLRAYEPVTLLDTTSLVHESYMRLANAKFLPHADPGRFLAYASHTMRSVIVDLVRKRRAERRGGGESKAQIPEIQVAHSRAGEDDILRVNEALEQLAKADARLAQVVEMRYFAGLEEREIAATLGVTDRTVRREWQKARLLLSIALQ